MSTEALQLPAELQQETVSLQRQIASIKVVDGDTYTLAVEIGKQIKQRIKVVKEFFAPMKRRADEAKRSILDAENNALSPLTESANYLDQQATAYRLERERIANQQRREAEEVERRRIATARATEAAQAREQGKEKLAAAILGAPIDVPRVNLPPSATLPTIGGTRRQTYWKIEITDAALVPREWCCPDEKRIGEFAREQQENSVGKIPGVRVYADHKTF